MKLIWNAPVQVRTGVSFQEPKSKRSRWLLSSYSVGETKNRLYDDGIDNFSSPMFNVCSSLLFSLSNMTRHICHKIWHASSRYSSLTLKTLTSRHRRFSFLTRMCLVSWIWLTRACITVAYLFKCRSIIVMLLPTHLVSHHFLTTAPYSTLYRPRSVHLMLESLLCMGFASGVWFHPLESNYHRCFHIYSIDGSFK